MALAHATYQSPKQQAEQPVVLLVSVMPGDLGDTYHFLPEQGILGVRNRPLDPGRIDDYGRSLDTLELAGELMLLEIPNRPGQFYIVGGQHRISAINKYGDRQYSLLARVWTLAAVKASGRTLAELVALHNMGRAHSRADDYAIIAPSSPFYVAAIAAGIDLYLRARRARTKPVALYDLVVATLLAESMAKNHGPHYNRAIDRASFRPTVMERFTQPDPALVTETIAFLKWWNKAHLPLAEMGICGMGQRGVLAIGLCFYRENATRPNLADATTSFMKTAQTEVFRKNNGDRTTVDLEGIAESLRLGLNYRRASNRFTLFGRHGREG